MEDTKYIRAKDFAQLDWNTLLKGEFATNGKTTDGKSWGTGKGGTGYPGGNGHIFSVVDNDFNETVYELPHVLSDFIDWHIKKAKEEKANEIKTALNL